MVEGDEVQLNLGMIASERIEDGDDTGFRYARLEGSRTVFATSDKLFQKLRDAQRSMREKRFMHFDEKDIDKIEISKGTSKITLDRLRQDQWLGRDWMEDQEKAQFPADAAVIENLLTNLSDIEAESFVRDAPSENDLISFGLMPAKLMVTLGVSTGENRVLLIGETAEDKVRSVYVKSQKEPFVYAISDMLLDELSLNPLHYRSRVLAPLAEGATIKKIALLDLESNATLTELSLPERPLEELPLEDETALRTAELSGLIRRFMVKEYIPGPFQAKGSTQENEHVPWRFQLAVEIALPGGDSNITETRVYLFSERLGGTTQIGGTTDCDALFKLDQPMIDLIDKIVRNPIPPPLRNNDPP